nr:PepSY-associated TM helix domain-containing protein [uncultured Rhodoferax sp.]
MLALARSGWLKAHRWLGLSVGWLLAAHALVGTLLVVGKPLDQWWNQALFLQPASSAAMPLALDKVQQAMLQEWGHTANLTIRPPRADRDAVRVRLTGGAWEGTVFLDNQGQELGRRGRMEGGFNWLFELHKTLLLGDAGQAVLATMALLYGAMLVSGLVLWWPVRWPPNLQLRTDRGWYVAWFDWHRLSGALLGGGIAVCVVSGAYMAWPPLAKTVTAMLGQQAFVPPVLPRTTPLRQPVPWSQLVHTARAQWPQAQLGYIHVPAGPHKAVRVRLKLPDDHHPNGLSSVWLHPQTGEVVEALRWDQLDTGSSAVSVIYPLHTGDLGGWPWTVGVGLLGLALGLLGISGCWMWAQRRWTRYRRAKLATQVAKESRPTF